MGAIELKEALYTKCPLRFDQDGKFRILMVSDIHGGIGYEKEKTVRAMQALVDEAKPQLVILGGDIAGPGTIHVENEDQLRSLLDDISSPMEKAGIPWAHVYGNHDNNFGLSNERQQVVYESYPHCNKSFHLKSCFALKFPPDDALPSHHAYSQAFLIFQSVLWIFSP